MGLDLLLILRALLNVANLPIEKYTSVLRFSGNVDEQTVMLSPHGTENEDSSCCGVGSEMRVQSTSVGFN